MNIEKIEIYIDGIKYRLVPSDRDTSGDGISSLVAGKFSVDLSAKVVTDWGLNTFIRKNDGSEGRVHSLLVGDDTGTIKVALWDTHTDTIKDIQEGDTIVISNGYTKKGLMKEGKQYIELHAGTKSQVGVVPKED